MPFFGLLGFFFGFALSGLFFLLFGARLLRLDGRPQGSVAERAFHILICFDVRTAVLAGHFHGIPLVSIHWHVRPSSKCDYLTLS